MCETVASSGNAAIGSKIDVVIEAPSLISRGIIALLQTISGLAAFDPALIELPVAIPSSQVVLIAPMGSAEVLNRALPPNGSRLVNRPIALLTDKCRESELMRAIQHGVRVFLSVDAEVTELHQGLISASQGKAFCSSHLAPWSIPPQKGTVPGFEPYPLHISENKADPGEAARDYRLSTREAEVARLAASGHTDNQIAQTLFLSVATVKSHLRSVYTKLDIQRRTQLHTALRENTG